MAKVLVCQVYQSADPFYLLTFEQKAFKTESNFTQLSLRPSFYNNYNDSSIYNLKIRSEIFYNTNAPNLENMSDRWIGKGSGVFNAFNFSFRTNYVMGSIEPYYFIDQNANYDEPLRIPLLSQLNDNKSHHEESPFQSIGIRESQFYLHYKGVGAGISNANMWWGPGIHSSLVMSNNTSGFTHILLGTLEEKRYKNWGVIGRYIFSKFDDRNKYEPYFTSVILGLTYYSDPIVSIGITKSALTGGTSPQADSVGWVDAALAFLNGFTWGDPKTYRERWSYDDHLISTYISTYFPKSQLTIFLEVGRNDITTDFTNFILTPDHSIR
ncbi:hypothetical protein KKF86_06685, partial [bacterium]|nr:hypothetical protein [bacterium]